MFNIGFFKGQPTEYIVEHVGGRVRREGPGLAFYYLQHRTQIVAVPVNSADANFVFNEFTSNFQAVTIQGQFTYRIHDPRCAAALLNFTIDPDRRAYISEDPERLPQRVASVIQMETRAEIQRRSLEETLGESAAIAAAVLQRVREGGLLEPLAVELLSLFILSARPTPEVAKALEALYRETLLRKADEALYARRAAAVTEERKIKESELNTEISLEQQREQFIDLQGANVQKEAEYRARATELELAAYQAIEPRFLLALALRDIGRNAAKVGNLTITTELLASLLNGRPAR
jgi:hypothetical protein